MARLKEKINDLKTQYGISEDAARELLKLHEGDLQEASAMLAEEQNKVVEWNKFWFEKSPQIEALAREYETLKNQMAAIQSATNPNYEPAQPQPSARQSNQPSPEELEQRVYRNFSKVQEDLWNVQKHHFDNYKSIPDLTPIKKLIEERGMTPWAAYQEWVAPMEKERTEKELREKITAELTEKLRNEATRTGVNSYMLSNKSATTGEEVTSPLDEVLRDRNETAAQAAAAAQKTERGASSDPSEFELLTDFVQSMRQGRASH